MSTTTQRTPRTTVLHPGRPAARAIAACQVHAHRRSYTRVVLRALARSQQGRPTAQVQRMLRNCFTTRGVRVTAATLHELAGGITAGRAVELP
jgi:hypothetical protein